MGIDPKARLNRAKDAAVKKTAELAERGRGVDRVKVKLGLPPAVHAHLVPLS